MHVIGLPKKLLIICITLVSKQKLQYVEKKYRMGYM